MRRSLWCARPLAGAARGVQGRSANTLAPPGQQQAVGYAAPAPGAGYGGTQTLTSGIAAQQQPAPVGRTQF